MYNLKFAIVQKGFILLVLPYLRGVVLLLLLPWVLLHYIAGTEYRCPYVTSLLS